MDSEPQQQKGMTSGESTPHLPFLLCSMLMTLSDSRLLDGSKGDVSIFFLHRNDSQETITSTSITEVESVASTQSRIYPAPPLNSPMTMSEVGDRELPNAVSRSNLPSLSSTPPTKRSSDP